MDHEFVEVVLRSLEDLGSLEGARVLVRTDLRGLGVAMSPHEDFRLLGTLSTLDWLRERGAAVAVCSTVPGVSTFRPSLGLLREVWGRDVQLVPEALDGELSSRLDVLPGRAVLLLENLANHADELDGDEEFARRLMAPFTHFVSDGFESCHQSYASVAVVPRMMPRERAVAGRSLQVEVDALTCLMNREDRPFVAVVAGRCLLHDLSAVERLLERADRLVCGGDVALAMLSVDGHDVGRSCLDATFLDAAEQVRERAVAESVELVVPADLMVEGHDRPLPVADVDPDVRVLDIGPRSLEAANAALDGAHTAFWSGQMAPSDGRSDPVSDHVVARAMARVHGYSVSAGVEILSRLSGTDLAQHISHVTTGGTAALAYIGGRRIPGLVPLES